MRGLPISIVSILAIMTIHLACGDDSVRGSQQQNEQDDASDALEGDLGIDTEGETEPPVEDAGLDPVEDAEADTEPDAVPEEDTSENGDPCSELPEGCCSEDCACPSEGQLCLPITSEPYGVCKDDALSAGQCWSTGDCSNYRACFGVVLCPCNQVCVQEDSPGRCEAASGACCDPASVGDCGAQMTCMEVEGGEPTCHAILSHPHCWSDEGCFDGERCERVGICDCNMDCLSNPGFCIDPCDELADGCCSEECPCEGEAFCMEFPDSSDTCLPILSTPECWQDEDCPGERSYCADAVLCSCEQDCISEPGECREYPDQCQELWDTTPIPCCSVECPCQVANQSCVFPDDTDLGVCKEAPEAGRCWVDGDCPQANQTCLAASLCPCGEECIMPDSQGWCTTDMFTNDCCDASVDPTGCSDDQVCVPIADGEDTCHPQLFGFGCWTDDDCEGARTCQGATLCSCEDDCLFPIPGRCR